MLSHKDKERFRNEIRSLYDIAYFEEEYWKEDLPGKSGNRNLSYDDVDHKNRFKLLAEAILKVAPPTTFLDAGCGPGLLIEALTGRVDQVHGVDVSEAAISLWKNRRNIGSDHNLEFGDIIELPYSDRFVDTVICLDVLEHLPFFDVEKAIAELFRVAGKKVILSINTDNPYKYHPTILSPGSWRLLLSSDPNFLHDESAERLLNSEVLVRRPEYQFFCYARTF